MFYSACMSSHDTIWLHYVKEMLNILKVIKEIDIPIVNVVHTRSDSK